MSRVSNTRKVVPLDCYDSLSLALTLWRELAEARRNELIQN